MYRKLAKKFGLKIAKTIDPIPGAVKVLKDECYCSLCETTSVEYILMQKYTDGIWKNFKTISKEEANKIFRHDSREDRVSCCPHCKEFLMNKDKEELALIIMRTRSPMLLNKAVKKVLQRMREREEKKNG